MPRSFKKGPFVDDKLMKKCFAPRRPAATGDQNLVTAFNGYSGNGGNYTGGS